MADIHIQYLNTCIGEVIMGSYCGQLCLLDYKHRKMRARIDKRITQGLNAQYIETSDLVLEQTQQQLNEYLLAQRQEFDLPLLMVGSDFQQSVWRALLKVPYGATASYLELAEQIGNAKAVRAVANANGANAIGIIIPCHRIIGSNGALVGYAGGLEAKKKLLALEQQGPLF